MIENRTGAEGTLGVGAFVAAIVPSLSAIVTVAVNAALPVRTLDDLVKLAHEQPGRLTWSAGPTLPRYTFKAFLKRHNLDMTYVGYRDATQPQADLGEGRIHVLITSLLASALPVQTGKARFIAIANPARAAALADVPTAKEAGYPERERTAHEYSVLLGEAGFRIARIVPVGRFSLIEALVACGLRES